MDTLGNKFACIIMDKNNSLIFRLYLYHLINLIQKEGEDYMEKVVLNMDNSSIHHERTIVKLLLFKRINWFYSSPYSYVC